MNLLEMRLNLQFINSFPCHKKALRTNNVTVDLSSVFPVTNSKPGKLFGQLGIGERDLNWAEGFTYRVPYNNCNPYSYDAIFEYCIP